MIIDHIGIGVADMARSKAFYAKALAPLGIAPVSEGGGWVGMGRDGKPEFWFGPREQPHKGAIHLAFTAGDREKPFAIDRKTD